jgi:hypothetical protein
MALAARIKLSLDELRMQMLGVQVLLGFQFRGLFQPGFAALPEAARVGDAIGLVLMVFALALLIAVPCQHRLVEQGESTPRLFGVAREAANVALVPIAAGLSCDVLVATCSLLGFGLATLAALGAFFVALLGWYGLPYFLRADRPQSRSITMEKSTTPLHAKIEQMLTEARVVLPGTQALLGFQLVVLLSAAFKELPRVSQDVHLAALFANVIAIVLLICPAAVHRMTFEGRDETRMHTIGSALITLALAPLMLGISLDLYVALERLLDSTDIAVGSAVAALVLMSAFWYGVPLYLRRKVRFSH